MQIIDDLRQASSALLLSGLVLSLTACSARPRIGPPGTINQQRIDAVLHDPFPDNRAGPEIMGGRPLGYQRPLSESESAQTIPYPYVQ